MRYSDLKHTFISTLLRTGENGCSAAPDEVRERVPEHILQRWCDKFYATQRFTQCPVQPRLINHFKLGADPEFAFVHGGGIGSAEDHNLASGLAFGADNNGRLVELRPEPSRFALHVLASMLSELRWLSVCRPMTTGFAWKAGAWSGYEGLGGHVHFGRKVKSQFMFEVGALDKLTELLLMSEVFPSGEHLKRRSGNGHGHYGDYSDVRFQRHGYEYRTAPSWLDSPWKAYLFMTLAKLVVARPDIMLMRTVSKVQTPSDARKFIRNTLATFKGLDDDARIASIGYSVWGLPQGTISDFKHNWGISVQPGTKGPEVIPSTIVPSQIEIEDVFKYLCNGTVLQPRQPVANWDFQSVPKGYFYPFLKTGTLRSPGIGELLCDILTPLEPSVFKVAYQQHDRAFINMSPDLVSLMTATAFSKLKRELAIAGVKLKCSVELSVFNLCVSKAALSQSTFQATKAALTSGALPLTRYRDLATFPRAKWIERIKGSVSRNRKFGRTETLLATSF